MAGEDSRALLAAGEMPERYQRNLGTLGVHGQMRLLDGRVAVVGAGGLGGHVIELLARLGVGYLRIIDGDCFAIHNLNRQVLATRQTLGRNKALVAAERVDEINSDVQILAVSRMLEEKNAIDLLCDTDVVVDALDSIPSRLLLSRTAQKLRIPLVHAAIAGWVGQVATILPEGPGLEKIYRTADPSQKGIENLLGTPAPTPALAAAIQVREVVKILTGVGQTLAGKLLYFDTGLNTYEILDLE